MQPFRYFRRPAFLGLASFLTLVAGAAASQPPGRLVSGLPFAPGDAANGLSGFADATPDGRFVLISTEANNLHAADVDLNATSDVYLLDRTSGAWQLISHRVGQPHRSASTSPQMGGSTAAAVSDDGRYVLFASPAPDLIATQQTSRQIYLYDRVLGASTLVSHLPGLPEAGTDGSLAEAFELSADGRYALFSSSATDLIAGSSGFADHALFLFDRETGANRLVSRGFASSTTYADGDSTPVQLSADGRFVLFHSFATNLAAGITDINDGYDVFLWDGDTGAVTLLSRHPAQPNALGGFGTGISADGRYALLGSGGALQAGMSDNNGASSDCYLHDRQTGASQLVSRQAASSSAGGSGASYCSALSGDGRFAYFTSQAEDLVSPFTDANGEGSDLFLFDRGSGGVTLVSHSAGSNSTGGNGYATTNWQRPGGASPDGDHLLFLSSASDLEPGADPNLFADLYLYDRTSHTSVRVSRHGVPGFFGDFTDFSSYVQVRPDGEALFSTSRRISASARDDNSSPDVFSFDPAELEASLLSAATGAGISAIGAGTIFENALYLDPAGRFLFWDGWGYDRLLDSRQLIGHRAGDPARPANGAVKIKGIDAAGRFVVLGSGATDLVAGAADGNNAEDVFLYDRSDKSAFLVSHQGGSPAVAANGASSPLWLSADGRRLLLQSTASDLLPNGILTFTSQLYFYDRLAGQATLVSRPHDSAGEPVNDRSFFVGISPEERFVLVASWATDWIPNFVDGNGPSSYDLYLYDRVAGQATLITHQAGASNRGASGTYGEPAATGDFRFVYFTSAASDLAAGSELPPGAMGFYRWDRLTNTTQLLMSQAQCHALQPRSLADVSIDGRLLLITTTCPQVPGDQNGIADVYVYDRITQQYQLISHQPGQPGLAKGNTWAGRMSDDGRRITYSDFALDDFHAFSYDRPTGQATDLRQAAFYDPATLVLTSRPWASADGNVLMLWIGDPAAAPYDANHERDLFLVEFDRFFADGFESGNTSAWSQTVP